MASSLSRTENLETCEVRVHDDTSSELSRNDLEQFFPFSQRIFCHDTNLGASGNMHRIFQDVMETPCEYVLLSDADLIFHPSWISVATEVLTETQGVLSLYNSVRHPILNHEFLGGHQVVEKASLGGAGVIIARRHIEKILKSVPLTRDWDWDWSRYFVESDITQYALKESLVQHIGISGEHSNGVNFDYGLNFYPVDSADTRLTIEVFQELLLIKDHILETTNNDWRNSQSFKIGNTFVRPYVWLRNLIRRS